jgi:hypothetical protein
MDLRTSIIGVSFQISFKEVVLELPTIVLLMQHGNTSPLGSGDK